MSRFFARIAAVFLNRTQVGVDKAGNRYFTRKEEIDRVMKEKRWVVFKGEEDPTTLPVEWTCWLNGQRKQAPTPEEMMELEARRERIRQNVALLKKEEEERRAKEGSTSKRVSTGKVDGPDIKSFLRQVPVFSEGDGVQESSSSTMGDLREAGIARTVRFKPEPANRTVTPQTEHVTSKEDESNPSLNFQEKASEGEKEFSRKGFRGRKSLRSQQDLVHHLNLELGNLQLEYSLKKHYFHQHSCLSTLLCFKMKSMTVKSHK